MNNRLSLDKLCPPAARSSPPPESSNFSLLLAVRVHVAPCCPAEPSLQRHVGLPADLTPLVNVVMGGRNSLLVVFGHAVAGFLWGNFPVEGIFPLQLTWVQTPFPQKLFRMRV